MARRKQREQNAVFHFKSTMGDGQVNVRILVELAAVGVQGTEDPPIRGYALSPITFSPLRHAQ